ncbi:hypothetical protein GCM10018952_47690 [Streptosporangium vulgare]
MVSMTRNASAASSGRTAATWLAMPALTAIRLMLCATTSCISRAIRSRSSATARPASCSAARAVYARRSRTARPATQAPPMSATPTSSGPTTPGAGAGVPTADSSRTATAPQAPIAIVGSHRGRGRVSATR